MGDKQRFNDKAILSAQELLLSGLGLDITDPNFKETPQRILRSYYEIFEGLLDMEDKISVLFSKTFPSTYSGIVTQSPIRCYSMCPHHFLPVTYTVHLGYMAHRTAIGLSKLTRLAILLAKRPVLQETYTDELCDRLFKGIKATGAIVIVQGEHLCMEARGVQKEAPTTTSTVRGCFSDPSIKGEFLSLIKSI